MLFVIVPHYLALPRSARAEPPFPRFHPADFSTGRKVFIQSTIRLASIKMDKLPHPEDQLVVPFLLHPINHVRDDAHTGSISMRSLSECGRKHSGKNDLLSILSSLPISSPDVGSRHERFQSRKAMNSERYYLEPNSPTHPRNAVHMSTRDAVQKPDRERIGSLLKPAAIKEHARSFFLY